MVDLGSDDDYIYVDHSNDDVKDDSADDMVDLGSDDDYIYVDHSNDDVKDDSADDRVDLGSDDDHVHVDHGSDDVKDDLENEINDESGNVAQEIDQKHRSKPRNSFVKSIISEVVGGETQLQPKEVKTVKGEFIDDDAEPLHKPAPRDEYVVEAEIVNGEEELNIFNDDLPDLNNDEKIYYGDDEELNIFNDELPDLRNDDSSHDISHIVDDAKKDYLDDMFGDEKVRDKMPQEPVAEKIEYDGAENIQASEIIDSNKPSDNKNVEVNESNIQDDEIDDIGEQKVTDEAISSDGVTYYQGSNDVTSKLRKNNFYYEDEKPRTVKDSIKGIKKDMKYINKSLKEIENPTKIDYVSVVDRTEEYNPADYLNMPSDDDSDKIIEREEELTFAEKEEIRIEKEMTMDALQKEIESDEEVIVPVHEQFRREELKDQALEDIILSANEDYKEIEKERHKKDNQLKAFDNHKLPGKNRPEDSIIDYVESDEIGLHSSDDLYNQPISKISDSIKMVVDIEGPIHVSEVTKRIKDSCNIKRAGSKLKRTVNTAIQNAEQAGQIIKIGDFLYDASNNDVVIRRRNKPNIELISDEEIAKSIELVLLHNNNVSTKQIAKETSRNFGFKSTSKKTASRINGVLDLMIANNRVKIENDYVELK